MAESHSSSAGLSKEYVTTMEEEYTLLEKRKAKKRAQNREAQRSYRSSVSTSYGVGQYEQAGHRIKVRNKALQVRVEQLEQTRQSTAERV